MNIEDVYEKSCGQTLRPQDKRLVYAFASELLQCYADEILEQCIHSDVDNHDFENGKESVAKVLADDAMMLKPC